MDRSDFQLAHSSPKDWLLYWVKDSNWISHGSLRILSTHAIPSTPRSRFIPIPLSSGKNRDFISWFPNHPPNKWVSCPAMNRSSLRHAGRGSTLQFTSSRLRLCLSTLLFGFISLQPVCLRRHPIGAVVGRLRHIQLPKYTAPLAIESIRFLFERDLHPQAFITIIMAYPHLLPLMCEEIALIQKRARGRSR